MIDRLLMQLDNPRRHLTFLVGLLALVFVLTTVVAWRATAAEQDRARIARNTLNETAALALADWNNLFRNYIGITIPLVAADLLKSDGSLNTPGHQVFVQDFCINCDATNEVRSVFTLDPRSGAAQSNGDPVDPAAARSIFEQLRSGRVSSFGEFVRGGMYFVEAGDEITAAIVVVRLGRDGTPLRIAGIVLDRATVLEMIDMAFRDARRLQAALAPHATGDQLFARSASAAGHALIEFGSSDSLGTTDLAEPVYGLRFAIGPETSAADFVEFGTDPVADRLTIVLLMLVISALLIMAVLQVRREAELTRLRADFISGVSHELRTPLAQIRMFTETLLLGRTRSDVERRRSLEIIDQEARRLAHLVENVLLFSRTESGRTPRVMPEPTHFAEEVRQAVESFTLLSRNRDVSVRTELQDNIMVEVDRMALRQILVNLVDNALKYGPTGQRITVGAALFDDVARLWVDDEGAGIPVEERARVFDSFYRLPRDVESKITGSGIGLAVVRELARLHGGDAWVESAPGRGARIVVQFPDAYLRSEQAGDFAAAS